MKLTTLKPRLQTLALRLSHLTQKPDSTPRTRGRKLQEWRARILRSEPLCRHCEAEGRVTAASEVDHIIPLEQGGSDLDDSNAQPLCEAHHKAKTAREATARANGAPARSW